MCLMPKALRARLAMMMSSRLSSTIRTFASLGFSDCIIVPPLLSGRRRRKFGHAGPVLAEHFEGVGEAGEHHGLLDVGVHTELVALDGVFVPVGGADHDDGDAGRLVAGTDAL